MLHHSNNSPAHHCPIATGCRARKTIGGKKILPQLQETDRPSGWRWHNVAYVDNPSGGFKCLYCNTVKKRQNTMQQHCMKHFPPTIHCQDCGDSFHIKTEYTQHFTYKCQHCQKICKGRTNLKAHYKRCKALRRMDVPDTNATLSAPRRRIVLNLTK